MKIKYNDMVFLSYIHLMFYLARKYDREIEERLFPKNYMFFIKYLLEEKFNRRFTFKEIKSLLRDKSWQSHTASQLQDNIKEV